MAAASAGGSCPLDLVPKSFVLSVRNGSFGNFFAALFLREISFSLSSTKTRGCRGTREIRKQIKKWGLKQSVGENEIADSKRRFF